MVNSFNTFQNLLDLNGPFCFEFVKSFLESSSQERHKNHDYIL